MSRKFPVIVTWRNEDDKPRSKGFDLLPRAQAFTKRLGYSQLSAQIWVQGELFSGEESLKSKAYSQGDEIPY